MFACCVQQFYSHRINTTDLGNMRRTDGIYPEKWFLRRHYLYLVNNVTEMYFLFPNIWFLNCQLWCGSRWIGAEQASSHGSNGWWRNAWISIKISLKFVPKVPMNNIPALVQIMAWCRPGDRALSAPVMGSCLTHIYVTLLKTFFLNEMFECILNKLSLIYVPMSLINSKPALVQVVMLYCQTTSHYMNKCWQGPWRH